MNTRMLVIVMSVVAVLLLVGVGVYVTSDIDAPVQAVKVYELPDSERDRTSSADSFVAVNRGSSQSAESDTVVSYDSTETDSAIIEQVNRSESGDSLSAAGEPCCDELSDVSMPALAPLDNPVPEAVTRDASAYLQWVKQHDAYLVGEDKLYEEREKLLASLLDMQLENTTPADVEAWIAKMKDWEKRSEALELTAPEPLTTEHQH